MRLLLERGADIKAKAPGSGVEDIEDSDESDLEAAGRNTIVSKSSGTCIHWAMQAIASNFETETGYGFIVR